jgi:DNA polymerase-3 subunit epsilon
MARFVVFDVETTGLSTRDDRIVSIAAIDVHTGRSFYRCVNPAVPVSRSAAAIHGLSSATLSAKPKWDVVGRAFWKWLAGVYEEPGMRVCLVGHNAARFDAPMLKNEFLRLRPAGAELQRAPLDAYVVDTLVIARQVFPTLQSKAQAAVYRHLFRRDAPKQHDAMGDARALLRIIKTPLMRAAVESPQTAFANPIHFEFGHTSKP